MESRTFCRNCRTPLAGEYCSRCGQREGRKDLSFSQVLGDALEELFDWDSRFWRTLFPLVFRPGFLTAEFIAGRRARYVPPLRLYLIVSFVTFLVVSLVVTDQVSLQTQGISISSTATEEGEPVIAPVIFGDGKEGRPLASADISLSDEDSPQWLKDLDARVEANAAGLADNPAAFIELLGSYLPQMMFVLLPLFALLLRICYLFSPFHYLQHLVFSLHYQSFAYLLYLAGLGISRLLFEAGVGGVLAIWFVIYLPLALRRVYGSGWPGAVARAGIILLADAFLLLFALAVIVLLALARL